VIKKGLVCNQVMIDMIVVAMNDEFKADSQSINQACMVVRGSKQVE